MLRSLENESPLFVTSLTPLYYAIVPMRNVIVIIIVIAAIVLVIILFNSAFSSTY